MQENQEKATESPVIQKFNNWTLHSQKPEQIVDSLKEYLTESLALIMLNKDSVVDIFTPNPLFTYVSEALEKVDTFPESLLASLVTSGPPPDADLVNKSFKQVVSSLKVRSDDIAAFNYTEDELNTKDEFQLFVVLYTGLQLTVNQCQEWLQVSGFVNLLKAKGIRFSPSLEETKLLVFIESLFQLHQMRTEQQAQASKIEAKTAPSIYKP